MNTPLVSVFKPSAKDYFLCFVRDAFLLGLIPTLLLTPAAFLIFGPLAYFFNYYLLLIPTLITLAPSIGLLFRKVIDDDDPKFKESFGVQFEGWKYIRLPKLFWVWDNSEVGAMGDAVWPVNLPKFLKRFKLDSFLVMSFWLTIRNPINNWQQWVGVKVDPNIIILYDGDTVVDDGLDNPTSGTHFVKAVTDGRTVYGYYKVKQYGNKPKCLRIRMGFKIKPNMDIAKYIKRNDKIGNAFIIAPYKHFGPK